MEAVKRKKRRWIVISVILPVLCIAAYAFGAGSDQTDPSAVPLESLLNADGTLNMNSGYNGSVDTRGWIMTAGENGAPRFSRSHAAQRDRNYLPYPIAGDESWVDDFGLPGAEGIVYALAVIGTDVYMGGTFTEVSVLDIEYIAKWNGTSWSTLGAGVNGQVYAIAAPGGDTLIVGGSFSTAGGSSASNIACWDGSSWSAMGSGTNAAVKSIAVSGNTIYAGGSFTSPGAYIAKWSRSGSSWSQLGTGTNGYVNTILVDGTDVYIGGEFTSPYARVARWNGSGWFSSGTISNGTVKCLATDGSNLYAGGTFTSPANRVARLNAGTWETVGTTGTNGDVNSMIFYDGDLYIGGNFTAVNGTNASNVAVYSDGSWSAIGDGTGSTVNAVTNNGADIYFGGTFLTAGEKGAARIALLRNDTWYALSTANDYGMNSSVIVIEVEDDQFYVGGDFEISGTTITNHIARWNGSNWEALGDGVDGSVNAIGISGTDVYVGGSFSYAGTVPANNIAKWNGTGWSALGGGTDGQVNAIAVDGTNIYVGGEFTSPSNRIALWTGSAWQALGSGLGGDYVSDIVICDGNVYAGGYFSTATGVTVNNVAYWDGSVWNAMGGTSPGTDLPVYALAANGSDVYVGGMFTEVDGVSNRFYLYKYNSGTWSAVGDPTVFPDGWVFDVIATGTDVYIGGDFSAIVDTDGGGTVISANRIAKFNGTSWSAFGSGVGDAVYAMGWGYGGLYVGGAFETTAGTSRKSFNIGKYLGEAPLVLLEAKLFLEGPYNSTNGAMSKYLNTGGYLPLDSPYPDAPRTVGSIPPNATDWVRVELRNTPSGAGVISKSVFLDKDGSIIDEDGSTQIILEVSEGSYYIVIYHRNHLNVMSASTYPLSKESSTEYDFTTAATQFYGGDAALLDTGVYGMYAGNANGSEMVNSADYMTIKPAVGNTGYYSEDVNLSAFVNSVDYMVVKPNVGKSTVVQ